MPAVSILPQDPRVYLPKAIRKADNDVILPPLRKHGFKHPMHGGPYVQLPLSFTKILALEPKSVTQVILEIFFQTLGKQGDGPGGRRLWAELSVRHFARHCPMSRSQAEAGLMHAIEKGYVYRRPCKRNRWEYAIVFEGIQYEEFASANVPTLGSTKGPYSRDTSQK